MATWHKRQVGDQNEIISPDGVLNLEDYLAKGINDENWGLRWMALYVN